MALKVFCMFFALAIADEFVVKDSSRQAVEECQVQENVTRADVEKFMSQEIEATPEIKDYFLCITQKLGTFDGKCWNKDEIKKIVNDPRKMEQVEECLKKDDKTLEPRERNFAVIACCLEKDSFM